MVKGLEVVLQSKDDGDRDQRINAIVDSLRYKIGAAGKDRINTIN